jgi:hypothetical protein
VLPPVSVDTANWTRIDASRTETASRNAARLPPGPDNEIFPAPGLTLNDDAAPSSVHEPPLSAAPQPLARVRANASLATSTTAPVA